MTKPKRKALAVLAMAPIACLVLGILLSPVLAGKPWWWSGIMTACTASVLGGMFLCSWGLAEIMGMNQ